MPLLLEGRTTKAPSPGSLGLDAERRRPGRQWRPSLEIGLVNNMPDTALRATEQQFCDILDSATGDRVVRLHLFSLPSVPRGSSAKAHMRSAYADLRDLRSGRLDALIVTGAEPKTKSLADEPYWAELAELVDWAEHNTISSVWSCLAAHAAVLHLDGIARKPLPEKRFGLFACNRVNEHPLLNRIGENVRVPHSRWNDLAEEELRAHGYKILTRSAEVGVDMFTKQWQSLFVFFQGHPEYNLDTLFREYRRDLTRYLKGERDTMPELPVDYFDPRTERTMANYAMRTQSRRCAEAVVRLPADWSLEPASIAAWRSPAVQVYRNWIEHVAAVKSGAG